MDTEVVQMLLGAGADPHCEVGGKTVPDVALEKKIRAIRSRQAPGRRNRLRTPNHPIEST